MGEESCTIDLETSALSAAQAQKARCWPIEIIAEDRPITISFVSLDQARQLEPAQAAPKQTGDLRLIDITDLI